MCLTVAVTLEWNFPSTELPTLNIKSIPTSSWSHKSFISLGLSQATPQKLSRRLLRLAEQFSDALLHSQVRALCFSSCTARAIGERAAG
jgi:hypothetical protein